MKGHGVRGVGYALAVALLAATSSVSITVAQAQQSAQRQFTFNIPSKPVTQAVNDIGRVTGLSVVFRENRAITANGNRVRGWLTAQQALSALLAGTGLTYRFSNATTVQIFDPSASADNGAAVDAGGSTVLETITVEGQGESAWGPVDGIVATRSATGSKTDAPLIETPQAISVISRKQMDEQGGQTVSDTLRYTAGLLTGTGGTQSHRFDSVFIRGFGGYSANANFVNYLDGLKWPHPYRTAVAFDPYMLERVEVFKGPSSVLYGQATPGGFVNLISKKPTEQTRGEVFTSYGSYGQVQAGFDLSGPVTEDGSLLYRVIGMGRTGDAFLDFDKDQRVLLAPSLTWKPNEDTSLTIQATYQNDPKVPNANFLPVIGTVLPNPNGQLGNSFNQGDPNWNLYSRTQASIGYQLEHRFNDVFTFRQNLRYAHMESETRSVDFTNLLASNEATLERINRSVSHFYHDANSVSIDNQLQAEFDTGPVSHTLLTGLDYYYMSTKWRYGVDRNGPPLYLYDPVYGQPITPPTLTFRRKQPVRQIGVYAQDQIAYENWRLWLSGRYDWANTSNYIYNTVTNRVDTDTDTASKAFTGRFGLVYLFDNGLAPYVSYSTSFEPITGIDYHGNVFEPTTGEQYEAGIKYEPPGWDASITLSVFQITKQNVATADPDATHLGCSGAGIRCTIQNGEVRSRGFEAEGKATLFDNFDLIATYTYTDAEVTKSTTTATLLDGSVVSYQGKTPTGVPDHMASLWGNYYVDNGPLEGLSIGAGVRYVSAFYGTDANVWGINGYVNSPSKIPAYTLVDAAIGYDFGAKFPDLKGMKLNITASNLFDKTFVANCGGTLGSSNGCSYGEGRTVYGTLKYQW